MKKILLLLFATLIVTTTATALDYEGILLPDSYQLGDTVLQLNGQGMRKKFFFSIYAGALYTPERITSPAQAMDPLLPKVIRMHFVYDEVSAEKLISGFAESIDNNTPGFSSRTDTRKFLAIFNFPARKGDIVDMQFLPDGTLAVRHNDKPIGQVESADLCEAVLKIYFGPDPIESLKKGMLGG